MSTICLDNNKVRVGYQSSGVSVLQRTNNLKVGDWKPISETFRVGSETNLFYTAEISSAIQGFFRVSNNLEVAKPVIVSNEINWATDPESKAETNANLLKFFASADEPAGVNFNIPREIKDAGLNTLIVKVTGKDFAHIKVEGSPSLTDMGDYTVLQMNPLRDSLNYIGEDKVVTIYSSSAEYYSIDISDVNRLQILGMYGDSKVELFAVKNVADLKMPPQTELPVSFQIGAATWGEATYGNKIVFTTSNHNDVEVISQPLSSKRIGALNSGLSFDPRIKGYNKLSLKWTPGSAELAPGVALLAIGEDTPYCFRVLSITDSAGNEIDPNPSFQYSYFKLSEGLKVGETYTIIMELPTTKRFARMDYLQFRIQAVDEPNGINMRFDDIKYLK